MLSALASCSPLTELLPGRNDPDKQIMAYTRDVVTARMQSTTTPERYRAFAREGSNLCAEHAPMEVNNPTAYLEFLRQCDYCMQVTNYDYKDDVKKKLQETEKKVARMNREAWRETPALPVAKQQPVAVSQPAPTLKLVTEQKQEVSAPAAEAAIVKTQSAADKTAAAAKPAENTGKQKDSGKKVNKPKGKNPPAADTKPTKKPGKGDSTKQTASSGGSDDLYVKPNGKNDSATKKEVVWPTFEGV